MKINVSYAVLFLSLVCHVFSDTAVKKQEQDTVKNLSSSDTANTIRLNPTIAGGLSLVLPGSGQFYTKHYFKGSIFLLSEGAATGVAVYWLNNAKDFKKTKNRLFTNAYAKADSGSKKLFQNAEYAEYDERRAKYRGYNALAWAGGLYVYSFLDAVAGTDIIEKTGERNPLRAGLLSAIPGLGLGQLYNGSLSKAGMVFMGQLSLGVTAVSYHRLMNKANREYEKVKDAIADDNEYETKWKSDRNSAFNYRNTYLWYSIFYYFFGVFDAVVDAHLHDYSDKMRLYPDLAPKGDGAQLRFETNF